MTPRSRARPGVRWTRLLSIAILGAASTWWGEGSALAQVARIQNAKGSVENGSSVAATWPAATGAGRLLVALVAFGGGTAATITPPDPAWTLVRRENHGASQGGAIYYWPNASPQSGASTWGLGSNTDATIFLIEYQGVRGTDPLDVAASQQGNVSPLVIPAVVTTQSDEIVVALGSVHKKSVVFSDPTSGFSLVDSDSAPGNGQESAFFAERVLTATGTTAATVSEDGANSNWVGLAATFKVAAKYWRATTSGGAGDAGGWADTSGGATASAPGSSDIVIFDDNGPANCLVTAPLSVRGIEIRPGFAGTITHAAGVTVTVSGGFSLLGGAYQNEGGTLTVGGAGQISGGTFSAGTGSNRFGGGLTVSSAASLQMPSSGGELALGAGTTLQLDGTLSATATTAPTIRALTGSFTFSVGATAVLDVAALVVNGAAATGMTIANGATYTRLRGVQFRNNAGGVGSRHLQITANALDLVMPGVFFDGSAQTNIRLIGNGDGDGATRLTAEDRGAPVSGARAGEAFDDDDDDDTAGGGNGLADNPSTNGAVVQWVRSAPFDTAGQIAGYPTPAFDWNTFAWYATYVGYRNAGGAGTADRVYVRGADGDALYAYDLAEANGDLVGTPHWDTVNEVTSGLDANGDGDVTDAAVHVLYLATTTGKIVKLVDTGGALVLPGAASPWTAPFTDGAVSSITSPLISDGNNLYFGGADASALPRIYAVQVGPGPSERTLARNVLAAGPIRTAPAVAVINGASYLFAGSEAAGGTAHLYRIDVATGLIDADYTSATGHLTARVTVVGGHVHVGDTGGRLHGVDGADFTGPLFEGLAGFPFSDGINHASCGGVCGISAPSYVDMGTGRVYFGDQDGHLYAVAAGGTIVPGYPVRGTTDALTSGPVLRNGILAVGTNAGRLLLVDESTATLVRTYRFGSAAISTVAFDINRGQYLLATDSGGLYFVAAEPDPTP